MTPMLPARLTPFLLAAVLGLGLPALLPGAQGQIPGQAVNQPCTTCNPSGGHAADLDGDGLHDVLSTSAFDNKIAWYKNEGGSYGPQQVLSTAVASPETVTAADLDDDGDLDVVAGGTGDDEVVWFENQIGEPGADSDGFGLPQVIASSNGDVLSVAAGHINGDDKPDVLIGARDGVFWFSNQIGESGDDFSAGTKIGPFIITPVEVRLADLDGDDTLDALYMHNGNFGEVRWHDNTGNGFGASTLITDQVDQPNDVTAASVDDDDALEVLTVSSDGKVAWYDNDDSANGFGGQTVIKTVGNPQSVAAGDADDDGDADVFTATQVIGGTDRISWYESQVGEPGSDGDGFGDEQFITTDLKGMEAVLTTDRDGDAAAELLSLTSIDDKIAWYDRTEDGYGAPQPVNVWPDAIQPQSVAAAALDTDAGMDVLVASQVDDKVSWYENTDGQGTFSDQRLIAADARKPQAAVAADLNGDDKPDAVVAEEGREESGRLTWFENQTGEGTDDAFGPRQNIATPGPVHAVVPANLDDDADLDLLVVYGGISRTLAWYENEIGQGGDADGFGAETVIASGVTNLLSTDAADFNGDGATDVIAGYGFDPGKVVWYENTDGGSFGEETVITNAADEQVAALATGNLDGDDDPDVLSASFGGDGETIAWYENEIGQGGDEDGFGSLQPISSAVSLPEDLHVADPDADGDLDVLSASSGDDKVAWYTNLGGSFSDQKIISSSDAGEVQGAVSVTTADVNGDDALDVLAASTGREEVLWHENTSGVLPVELDGFDATVDGDAVRLSWSTASETRNAEFQIQRRVASTPGVRRVGDTGREGRGEWETVGSVEGGGTTSQVQSYRFTDEDLPYEADRLTYRLRQVDTDGSASLSRAVTVERSVQELQLLGTYPNPARQRATVRYALPEKQKAAIRLYDALGRQVRTVLNGTQEGRHKQRVDLSGLPSGVYFLRLRAGGETRTQKLTVMR